ncbi:MAG TPA: DUF6660 family protein [Chitinophagaceae bacterium]|nr:DUF6660 family protein [Chitinophagaceae bacterium]
MKLFAFIMSLVVVIVSLAPCRDMATGSKAGKANVQVLKDDQHAHEDGSDDCPPFCSCSCCSVQGCLKPFFNTLECVSPEASPYSSYYTGALISISLPIWQPPQLIA